MDKDFAKFKASIMGINEKPPAAKQRMVPNPSVSRLTAFAKGGKVVKKADGGSAYVSPNMAAAYSKLAESKKYLQKPVSTRQQKENLDDDSSTQTVSTTNRDSSLPKRAAKKVQAKKPEMSSEDFIKAWNKKNNPDYAGDDAVTMAFKADREAAKADREAALKARIAQEESDPYDMAKGGRAKSKSKDVVMGSKKEAAQIMGMLKKAKTLRTPPSVGLGVMDQGSGDLPSMPPQRMPPRQMGTPMKHGGKAKKMAMGGAGKMRKGMMR